METEPLKNPGTAAVLSLLLPGLGHLYNGRFFTAFLAFLGLVIGALTAILLIGIHILIATYLFAIVGAYETAEKDNQKILEARQIAQAKSMKDCPDCAETILAEARKCRFCGYEFK